MEEYLTRARSSYDNGENPEIGMTTPLLDFVNGTFLGQNTQCIEGPGGEGSGSIPDGRIQRQIPGSNVWRTSCFVEIKAPDVNLDVLCDNVEVQNRQIYNHLHAREYLLLTNLWDFRLLQRNANEAQWPPVELCRFRLSENAVQFRILCNNFDDDNVISLQEGFAAFVNNQITPLQTAGVNSLWDFREALFDLYNHTNSAFQQNVNLETSAQWNQQLNLNLPHLPEEEANSLPGKLFCNGLILQASQAAMNAGEDGVELTDISLTTQLNSMFRIISENIDNLNLGSYYQRFLDCCCNHDELLSDFTRLEREFWRFLNLASPGWSERFGFHITPNEIVNYMIHISDRSLRRTEGFSQSGILRDNASGRAVILDPCAGTGRFYIGVLRFIFENTNGEMESLIAVANAIGLRTDAGVETPSRIHAFDIQPSCVMYTRLALEHFLNRINMPIEMKRMLRPSIRLTDALSFWPGTDEGVGGDLVTNQIKSSEINVIIGNPPWRGRYTQMSPQANQLVNLYTEQNRSRTREILTEIGFNQGANPTNPYEAFFGACLRKISNYPNSLICFVAPDDAANSPQKVGLREQLVAFGELYIHDLGGDYRKAHTGSNLFRVSIGNAIYCVRPSTDANSYFLQSYQASREEKRAHILELANSAAVLDAFEEITPAFEEVYSFPRWEEAPNWPTIDQMYLLAFTPLQEQRGMTLIDASLSALRERVQTGVLTESFQQAQNELPLLWRGRGDGIEEPFRGWSGFNPEVEWNRLNQMEQMNIDGWYSTITRSAFNHLHAFVPPALPREQRGNLWNRARDDARLLANDDVGKICVASREINYGNFPRACWVPQLTLGADPMFRNGRAIPTYLSGDVASTNLTPTFTNWLRDGMNIPLEIEDSNLSNLVWMHVLCVLNTPTYLEYDFVSPPGGEFLPIPFPASWELFQLSATHGEEIARLQTLSNDVEHSDCLREYAELSNQILNFFDFNPSSTNNNELTPIQIAQAGFQPDSRHATGGSRISARNNFFEYDAANNGIIESLQNNENLNQELISQNSDFISQLEGLGVRRIRIDNDVVVSGIPAIVADFNIGQKPGSNLVSMWLAWRSENQRGGDISDIFWNQFSLLIRNILTQILFMNCELNQTYSSWAEDVIGDWEE